MKTLTGLVIFAFLLVITVGFLFPSLPVSSELAPTVAPTPWVGNSVPMTWIACAPPPCDCWPDG